MIARVVPYLPGPYCKGQGVRLWNTRCPIPDTPTCEVSGIGTLL